VASSTRTFVIVGANLTGGAAVTTLRDDGFDGRLVLIGTEPHPPYERPPLSKEYLRGEASAEHGLLHPLAWYDEADVELRLGTTAAGLDPESRTVQLDDGDRVRYDQLLLATGGVNRRLGIPGHDLDGVIELRTIEDADRLRAAARVGARAVVIGAGFIGCEVAASLRQLGVEVDVVEPLKAPLLRPLGAELGRVVEAIHRDHGVGFHFGEAPERIEGSGAVERVVTTAGRRIECDFVLVGVGIRPNTKLAERAGLEIEDGVVVDELCRASAPNVFAAGDVAAHWHPLFGRRLRVEHWDNALKQGAAAARNMLGRNEPFDDPHWFWSDQYEHNLQYLGFAPEWNELVIRGSLEDRSFTAFYMVDEVVKAVVSMDRPKDVRRSVGLVRAQLPVALSALRDEDVDLKKLGQSLRASEERHG
jgi:3-phenylpropionate/trans-cinnamate dioxygenase ferredoxin reductase component